MSVCLRQWQSRQALQGDSLSRAQGSTWPATLLTADILSFYWPQFTGLTASYTRHTPLRRFALAALYSWNFIPYSQVYSLTSRTLPNQAFPELVCLKLQLRPCLEFSIHLLWFISVQSTQHFSIWKMIYLFYYMSHQTGSETPCWRGCCWFIAQVSRTVLTT